MEMAIGIDVIVISRVKKVLQKHPERFLRRSYAAWEYVPYGGGAFR